MHLVSWKFYQFFFFHREMIMLFTMEVSFTSTMKRKASLGKQKIQILKKEMYHNLLFFKLEIYLHYIGTI